MLLFRSLLRTHMHQICVDCGEPLPRFRLIRLTCTMCKTKYRATRFKRFSYTAALYGAAVPAYPAFVVFAPLPMWLKLYVIPPIYVMAVLLVSAHQTNWVPSGPNNSFKPNPHQGGA